MKKLLLTILVTIASAIVSNAVTFNVTVPEGTKSCFIAGDFNGWDAANAVAMSSSGVNTFTLTLEDVSEAEACVGYKYLCGQDWAYVEKGASGEELSNRTAVGAMDVVASWAKTYNPDIIETKLTVNGYTRIVKILLPSDYATSNKSYPVVYMTGVQARYDNAGDDSDRGDDHMSDLSWNITGMAKEVSGANECIFVSMYGFVAENTPFEYADFAGTGAADSFIQGIEDTLMPYVKSNYRVLSGAENTSIVGGDLGGLFSVYAAVKRPDLFGQCAALSPSIWLNKNEIINYVSTASTDGNNQRFYLSVGGNEPADFQADVADLKEALATRSNADIRFTTFTGVSHNDVAWGKAFRTIFPYLLSGDAADAGSQVALSNVATKVNKATALQSTSYSFLSAIDSQDLVYDSNVKFTYMTDFVYEGVETEAQVAIIEIPASVKTKYYWNVTRSNDGSGAYIKSTNGNIGFSSKKTTTSWLRVVILGDETVKDIAANSAAFRVVTADKEVTMTQSNGYKSTATVTFGTSKTFKVHFGSVNSGSKQSSLTEELSVSDNCTSAVIEYDFYTNKVTITENGGGEGGEGDDEEGETPTTDLASTSYSIVSAIDSQDLVYDANTKFNYTTKFISSGNEVEAQVAVTEIPASVKTKYYWNVSRSADGTGTLLMSENGDIGFSSKKTTTSWHRVAILTGENISAVAANSAAFRLVTADESITMSITGNYTVKASADFLNADKSFSIHFGSVNSGSDMGAVTSTYSVSDNCIAADIVYDFTTNSVTITETKWGETINDVIVEKFIAVPSICNVGSNSKVSLKIPGLTNTEVSVKVNLNYGNYETKTLTKVAADEWSLDMSDLQAGIYHLSLCLKKGDTELDDYRTIAIKVINGEYTENVVVNPYSDIDWSTIKQYKANFHTHTTQSFDANLRTDETVDSYYNAGYQILALTDHDANPYPWDKFNLFNPTATNRTPESLNMLAIPGNELSKSYTNSWNEVGGSEFNHHNDFFTGRQGMEFATLRESYAYTEKLGGMQLINHPGQYWSLSKQYTPGEKNSPEWHAENFLTYKSLIGLEVYNQGNRRPNDRILWDQILDITMAQGTPVWGYSCDDMHNTGQLFRNYNFMLMEELTIEALKDAMRNGTHYFSYEYAGSGQAKAPRINDIKIDADNHTITIDTDATDVYWICSTDIKNSTPDTRKSTVLAVGKEFDYTGYQGRYVRALLTNEFGETCTQPFGFKDKTSGIEEISSAKEIELSLYPNPASDVLNIKATGEIKSVKLYDIVGRCVLAQECGGMTETTINVAQLISGNYIVAVETEITTVNKKLIIK